MKTDTKAIIYYLLFMFSMLVLCFIARSFIYQEGYQAGRAYQFDYDDKVVTDWLESF